jgi:hypothetical protein
VSAFPERGPFDLGAITYPVVRGPAGDYFPAVHVDQYRALHASREAVLLAAAALAAAAATSTDAKLRELAAPVQSLVQADAPGSA